MVPNYTVTVLNDTVEEQSCIGVALGLFIAGMTHTVTVVEGQPAPSSLLSPVGQR